MSDEAAKSHRSLRPSRRHAAGAVAGFLIVPPQVLGGQAGVAPSDKLNLAGVGVGGMGSNYLRHCESENIVALADVDYGYSARVFARYPGAKTYRDFRELLDREKSIDAVIIGTPDHTHARVAMAAMELGKHVYCAKPLTRTIFEARQLARTAREKRVATQMSVQSSASADARLTEEWIAAGAVGEVREVHVWSDRPIWPQAIARPREAMSVPKTLSWDLWLGPAPARPYHVAYHPFSWRGWVDFGTGALGDMACHAFHVVFRALELTEPVRVSASAARVVRHRLVNRDSQFRVDNIVIPYPETFPHASIVTWDFPARGTRSAVRMHWYDGGLKPALPAAMPSGKILEEGGICFVGNKGTLLAGFTGGSHLLLPEARAEEFSPPPETKPRVKDHYQEWINACKGGPAASCEFGFGSLLTETALLGTIACRTGKSLDWDASAMRFPNDASAQPLLYPHSHPAGAI